MAAKLKAVWPVLVTLLVSVAYLGIRLTQYGGDPAALAELGTRFADQDPWGSEGYDGQFAYYMALDLNPETVRAKLDVPAYRYQRILYPLLARVTGLGNPVGTAWSLLALNLVAHTAGTYAVLRLIERAGRWPGYALMYGLWVGLIGSVGLDLHEPLAYALAAGGSLAWLRGRPIVAASLLGLSMFAKETSLLFWAAAVLVALHKARDFKVLGPLALGGAAFGAWQVWLWSTFGRPGLASGGAMATGFEWIPFMGLWRIGMVEPRALLLYLVIFGPAIIVPVVWGTRAAIWRLFAPEGKTFETWSLLLNAAMILFLPFSTFREPLGLVRVFTGVVLSFLLFSLHRQLKRPLNYAMFWIAFLVLLLPG